MDTGTFEEDEEVVFDEMVDQFDDEDEAIDAVSYSLTRSLHSYIPVNIVSIINFRYKAHLCALNHDPHGVWMSVILNKTHC